MTFGRTAHLTSYTSCLYPFDCAFVLSLSLSLIFALLKCALVFIFISSILAFMIQVIVLLIGFAVFLFHDKV